MIVWHGIGFFLNIIVIIAVLSIDNDALAAVLQIRKVILSCHKDTHVGSTQD